MGRPIMPLQPRPWSPTETILAGLGAAVIGQFFPSQVSRYGFVVMGVLLVVLGVRDWRRARRKVE